MTMELKCSHLSKLVSPDFLCTIHNRSIYQLTEPQWGWFIISVPLINWKELVLRGRTSRATYPIGFTSSGCTQGYLMLSHSTTHETATIVIILDKNYQNSRTWKLQLGTHMPSISKEDSSPNLMNPSFTATQSNLHGFREGLGLWRGVTFLCVPGYR